MKPFTKILLLGGAAIGGYMLFKPKSSADVSPPSPVPQPVPPPRPSPGPAPRPAPAPTPPTPGPTPIYPPSPSPTTFKYPVGSVVTMRDFVGLGTTMQVMITENNVPPALGDYKGINADCLAGPSAPMLCSFYNYFKASDIVD